jgi:hypothetical protein
MYSNGSHLDDDEIYIVRKSSKILRKSKSYRNDQSCQTNTACSDEIKLFETGALKTVGDLLEILSALSLVGGEGKLLAGANVALVEKPCDFIPPLTSL